MRIITTLQDFPSKPDFVAVALGNFDGVHRGHQILLKNLVKRACEKNGISVVFTFNPHPFIVLGKNNRTLLLNTLEDKEKLIANLGVDFFIPFPFNKEVANMSPPDFVNKILSQGLQAKSVFVGYNFTFGRNAEGTPEILTSLCKEQGCEVHILPEVKQGEVTVSSTNIKEFLCSGNVKMANSLLGYSYNLFGRVISGNQIGRKIGFPTANLDVPQEMVIPENGVYAVKVKIKEEFFNGVANIGKRPTIGQDLPKSVEIHILDQKFDLYNNYIRVFFIERLRPEIKFPQLNKLMAQIDSDVESAKNILKTAVVAKEF